MIVADQRDRLEDLRFVEMPADRLPSAFFDRASVDQIVDELQQGLLLR